jgi:hypothetical protein
VAQGVMAMGSGSDPGCLQCHWDLGQVWSLGFILYEMGTINISLRGML